MTYPDVTVLQGCCLETLKTLRDESVHMVCTSPPYFGLRDYGTGRWEGGSAECDHLAPAKGGGHESSTLGPERNGLGPDNAAWADSKRLHQYRDPCGKCGARRVDQQIGLEASADCGGRGCGQCWICKMVEVFREVRRVLRRDGTVWLNVGDSYACAPNGRSAADTKAAGNDDRTFRDKPCSTVGNGFKAKDQMLLPHRLAIALQNDGWWIRSTIVWAKPNPLPESVVDRPTTSHEYVFLLSRSEKYFFDQEAIREKHSDPSQWKPGSSERLSTDGPKEHVGVSKMIGNGRHRDYNVAGRNKRTVWTIPTEPFPESHFAIFPRALVRPCILAGTSAEGCCHACGAPFCRVVEAESVATRTPRVNKYANGNGHHRNDTDVVRERRVRVAETTGWAPSCSCPDATPVPCTVLDIFAGSGTTLEVALSLGRSAIGIELNEQYIALIHQRISRAQVPLALGI